MTGSRVLSANEVADAGLTGWAVTPGGLRTRLATGDFATGLRLVARIGAVAEEADHHPDVDLRYPYVDLLLVSHDVGGLTSRDVALARAVSGIAAEEGVDASAEPWRGPDPS